jgi:hypothetical protein
MDGDDTAAELAAIVQASSRKHNVHGHPMRGRAGCAGNTKPSQLQHATTPPIWTQFKLRLKHMNRKNQENNFHYKRWQISMVCGVLPCREGWLAKQSLEQSSQLTLKSSAYSRRISLSCILRVLLLVVFYLLEL